MTRSEKQEPTPERILQDLWAARNAQVLVAGVELDLFTHIAAGNHSAKMIARASKASEPSVTRLLDALVALGYLNKKNGNYGLEPVAKNFLVRGGQVFLGPMVDETRMVWDSWAHLTEVVKTGRPYRAVDQEAAGRDFFPKLVAAIFPMSYGGARVAAQTLSRKQRDQITRILDVAAGSAAWSIAFAEAIPEARVTVVDYPEVCDIARQFTTRMGVADRYEYREGNLHDVDLGRNQYDLVILGHIIHAEGSRLGRRLVQRAYRALRKGGLLLIADMVPNDERTGPVLPLVFGLNMLLNTDNGDVFTMREYREWLKSAGFTKVSTIDAPGPSPLILATK